MQKAASALALILATIASNSAHATIIDFNAITGTAFAGSDFSYAGRMTHIPAPGSFSTQGFLFAVKSGRGIWLQGPNWVTSDAATQAYSNSNHMAVTHDVTLSLVDGGVFSLTSLDYNVNAFNGTASAIHATIVAADGTISTSDLFGGSISNQLLTVGNDFLHIDSPQFTNVRSIAFSVSRNEFALDNLSVVTVPEPSAFALFGLALAGLIGMRRKQQST